MLFSRQKYVDLLISHKHNGLIKIVTGMRRSGKSYLLFKLFKQHLMEETDKSHIIEIAMDDFRNRRLREPDTCIEYVTDKMTDDKQYYLLIDEVQLLEQFTEVLNTFLHIDNLDVYVTGSNSRFLVSDVVTEFRGRGDEIRVYPLSIQELQEAFPQKPFDDLLEEYMLYGGMPYAANLETREQKSAYLKQLFRNTYIRDIKERYKIQNDEALEKLIDIIASSVGSLTNPQKLENTFASSGQKGITDKTIKQYLDYLQDAFLIEQAKRYDVKGRKYISTPYKYYFSDLGLRNARLNFRLYEPTHLMENLIYNTLVERGTEVDVGIVEISEKQANGCSVRKQIEVDFVVNRGSERIYIQSAYALPTLDKREQEIRPLLNIHDSFKKIVIVRDNILLNRDDNGIVYMSLRQFLTDLNSLNL